MRIRDKESNLDLQIQSLASCRLDDPGLLVTRRGRPPFISFNGDPRNGASLCPYVTTGHAGRCFSSHSPYSSTLDHTSRPAMRVIVEELWSPVHAHRPKKALVNQAQIEHVLFRAAKRMGPYLPRAGPRFDLRFLQAEHHLFNHGTSVTKRKRATGWVALAASRMRLGN